MATSVTVKMDERDENMLRAGQAFKADLANKLALAIVERMQISVEVTFEDPA